ncbi:MAG: redoxin domain-containing protein [Phycisphaera sp.]|nr:redoxin domain-containing protein [Phycisphaera sp.]
MMHLERDLTVKAGALCIAVLLAGCGDRAGTPQAHTAGDAIPQSVDAVPTTLPVVRLDDLRKLIDETAGKGRVTVIDFWATWCVPCKAIFGPLHEGLVEIDNTVRPVTVTLDAEGYIPKAIKYLNEHDALNDAYALDPDADEQIKVVQGLGKEWSNLEVPAILIFDTQGKLAGEFLEPSPDKILARVREVIARNEQENAGGTHGEPQP